MKKITTFFLVFSFFNLTAGISYTNDMYPAPWDFVGSKTAEQMKKGIEYDYQTMRFSDSDIQTVQNVLRRTFYMYGIGGGGGNAFFSDCNNAYTALHVTNRAEVAPHVPFSPSKIYFSKGGNIDRSTPSQQHADLSASALTKWDFENNDIRRLSYLNYPKEILGNVNCSKNYDVTTREVSTLATNPPDMCFLVGYLSGHGKISNRVPGERKLMPQRMGDTMRSVSFCHLKGSRGHKSGSATASCDKIKGGSGSPLFCKIDQNWKFLGVASKGSDDPNDYNSSVYEDNNRKTGGKYFLVNF